MNKVSMAEAKKTCHSALPSAWSTSAGRIIAAASVHSISPRANRIGRIWIMGASGPSAIGGPAAELDLPPGPEHLGAMVRTCRAGGHRFKKENAPGGAPGLALVRC